jgi:TolB-like protein
MLEQLGHYKILDRIGSGGMGEVYRARDTRLGRTVAIKVLPPDLADDPDRRERFLREARVAAALSHPNIAALYEIGEDSGQLYLVFEFVPGEPLSKVIAGRPLNPRRAMQFATQVADALADAHAVGIVHCDIKPDNIVITPKGNAKVLDFGLAAWTAGGAARTQAAQAVTTVATAAGAALGTLAYMSPEQARGEAVDARTDIFSLGVALYEMLTGSRPFQGTTPAALGLQVVEKPVPPPSTINRGVPKELDAVVSRALQKDPTARFDSAAMLAAELRAADREIQDAPARTDVVIAPAAITRPRDSRTVWVLAAAAILTIGGAGALWYERSALTSLWRGMTSKVPQPVIAVIPLELAEGGQDPYFADGLTEDLITRLGQTAGIKVLGRSATRNYRGRSPADLARELHAGVVLTGTVRPMSESVKISLELIDPSDGVAMWAGQYTRELTDIFAVQAQVAEDVARALRLKLQPTAASERAAQRVVDRSAYDAYLRGREATAQRRLRVAKDQFAKAIAIDDGLAEAHAGLAEVLHLEAVFAGAADDPVRRTQLKSAAERAYELAPDLPQANLAKALASESFDAALGYLKRAIAFDPSYSEAFHQIGDQIEDFDPERAIKFDRQALALDPRMDINHADIASCLSMLGRFDEARAELDTATNASDWKTPLRVALVLDQGQYDLALQTLEQGNLMREAPIFALGHVTVLRMVNRRDDALREATRLVQAQPASCEAKAVLAGLRAERGQLAQAQQLVAPALKAGAAADVGPSALRCAVTSAAALGDGNAAAAILDRIAGDERLLRHWAFKVMGVTGSKTLRRNMFPWTVVRDQRVFVAARERLDGAYEATRQKIGQLLGSVTP